MAGDPHEADRPSLLRRGKGLDRASGAEDFLHLVFGSHIVDLPQIEIVRFHVSKRRGKMGLRPLFVPGVRLACQKDILSPLPQGKTVVLFTPCVGPGRFAVGDTQIKSPVDQAIGFLPTSGSPKNPFSTEPQDSRLYTRLAEWTRLKFHGCIIRPAALCSRSGNRSLSDLLT